MIINIVDQCDAIIAAWLPGTEANAIADVLAGNTPFTGKLSYSFPRSMAQVPLSALKNSGDPPLFAFGHGLET
jgi:beta-glucosidase